LTGAGTTAILTRDTLQRRASAMPLHIENDLAEPHAE